MRTLGALSRAIRLVRAETSFLHKPFSHNSLNASVRRTARQASAGLLLGMTAGGAHAQVTHRASLSGDHTIARLAKPSAKRASDRKSKAGAGKMIVYIGTFTNTTSKGIYIYNMDVATGQLTPAGVGPQTRDPSFLAVAPSHKYLYAVNEISDYEGKPTGAVSAFAIAPKTGALTLLNQQSSMGTGPCFVSLDAKGKNALVANYAGGSIACLPIGADGSLKPASASIQHQGAGADPVKQTGPHAHSINLDAANHYAFAADLGLDKIFVYRFDASKGTLTPGATPYASTAPVSGPRHFAFGAGGHYAYVINELNSTVTAFQYQSGQGVLKEIQTISTLPEGYTDPNSGAQIVVHPSGKFLYASNRGHNSIVIYAIDGDTGMLRLVGHESTQGKTPRNFEIDPTGAYLLAANQDTDNVVVFRVDAQTGKLTPTGQTLDIPRPVCVKFLPVSR